MRCMITRLSWLPHLFLGTQKNKILTLNCVICLTVLVTPLDFSPSFRMFVVLSKKYCLRRYGM